MTELNAILLKLVLVAITAPAWFPFLKAVWEELNKAMADEGGLFGRIPNARELEEVEREKATWEDPLVHESWPTHEQRVAGRRQFREGTQSTAQASSRAGATPPLGGGKRRSGGGFR